MSEELIRNMLFRAEIKEILENDGSKLQKIRATGLANEELKMMRLQTFGFSSRPPVGSLGLALALGGRRDQALLIGGEMPGKRFTDNHGDGSVSLYDEEGNHITLSKTAIKIQAQGSEITISRSTGQIAIKASAGISVDAPSMTFSQGSGGGQVTIGNASSNIDIGGTGGKRLRLEDGSLSASTIKAVN